MNIFKKAMIAAGMASVAVSPIAASAAQSTAVRTAPAATGDESDLRGDRRGLIYALFAIAAVAAALFITRDDDNDNDPVSP